MTTKEREAVKSVRNNAKEGRTASLKDRRRARRAASKDSGGYGLYNSYLLSMDSLKQPVSSTQPISFQVAEVPHMNYVDAANNLALLQDQEKASYNTEGKPLMLDEVVVITNRPRINPNSQYLIKKFGTNSSEELQRRMRQFAQYYSQQHPEYTPEFDINSNMDLNAYVAWMNKSHAANGEDITFDAAGNYIPGGNSGMMVYTNGDQQSLYQITPGMIVKPQLPSQPNISNSTIVTQRKMGGVMMWARKILMNN